MLSLTIDGCGDGWWVLAMWCDACVYARGWARCQPVVIERAIWSGGWLSAVGRSNGRVDRKKTLQSRWAIASDPVGGASVDFSCSRSANVNAFRWRLWGDNISGSCGDGVGQRWSGATVIVISCRSRVTGAGCRTCGRRACERGSERMSAMRACL